ncbi:MAG TPA: DUF4230 domain-containing protein [Arachidicoccus sp.]
MKFRFSTALLILCLVIIIGLLAYFLGKKNGSVKIENIVTNEVLIKQISELSSLEVHGTASIKNSNLANDGSISDNLKRMFMENTVNISVPFIAKYGVNLQNEKITLLAQAKSISIHLPEPQLLSYELLLDKVNADTKQGWLSSFTSDNYNAVEASLYKQTRSQLQNNSTYKKQTEEKILSILKDYYKPTGYNLQVQFGNEAIFTDSILKL